MISDLTGLPIGLIAAAQAAYAVPARASTSATWPKWW